MVAKLTRHQPGRVRERLGAGPAVAEVADDGCEGVGPLGEGAAKYLAEVRALRLVGVSHNHPPGAVLGQIEQVEGREPAGRARSRARVPIWRSQATARPGAPLSHLR